MIWRGVKLVSKGLRQLSFGAYLLAVWHDLWLVPLLALRFLTDFYQRTLLGFLWVFIRASLITVGVIVVLGQIELLSEGALPYALVVTSGMALWVGFDIGLTKGTRALLQVSRIWTWRWTPKPIFALSFNILPICYMLVFLPVTLGVFIYHHDYVVLLDSDWYLRVPVALLCTLLVLGIMTSINLLTSMLFLISRDIRFIMPAVKQLLFFGSPVIYSMSVLPPRMAEIVFWANPLAGVIETWRWAWFGASAMEWRMLAWSGVVVLVALLLALMLNLRLEGILVRISRI